MGSHSVYADSSVARVKIQEPDLAQAYECAKSTYPDDARSRHPGPLQFRQTDSAWSCAQLLAEGSAFTLSPMDLRSSEVRSVASQAYAGCVYFSKSNLFSGIDDCCLRSTQAISPVFRLLMKAGDHDDDDLQGRWFVDDAIWKSNHLTATNIFTQRMPGQGEFFDSLDCCPSFFPEFGSEIESLKVVVVDSVTKFALRRQQ